METPAAEVVKCNNCKCWRAPADFIGKRGNPVKKCVNCRLKEERYKSKEEVREKTRLLHQEKRYDIEYRAKKRAENEEEYLRKNAEMKKKYRDKLKAEKEANDN